MPQERRPTPFDYDDPVFRSGVGYDVAYRHLILKDEFRDAHPLVADRLALVGAAPVLDMGCGQGALGTQLDVRGVAWVGVDRSPTQLSKGHGPRVLGDARSLPFPDAAFGAVAALYMLYHFEDPLLPLQEARRVLRPGGVFVACAPSRFDMPELRRHLPDAPIDTFDSENAPELIGRVFVDVEVEPWDMLLVRLPSRAAVWAYLRGMQVPPEQAEDVARRVQTPLWVRKRGAVVWARKPA